MEYKNFETAIHGMITRRFLPEKFLGFYPIMKAHIERRKDTICGKLDKLAKSKLNGTEISCSTYNMRAKLDYEELQKKMSIALENI